MISKLGTLIRHFIRNTLQACWHQAWDPHPRVLVLEDWGQQFCVLILSLSSCSLTTQSLRPRPCPRGQPKYPCPNEDSSWSPPTFTHGMQWIKMHFYTKYLCIYQHRASWLAVLMRTSCPHEDRLICPRPQGQLQCTVLVLVLIIIALEVLVPSLVGM